MQTINIQQGQTMIDIALQYYGDVSMVVTLAEDNDIDVTEPLITGQTLLIDQTKIANKRIVEHLKEEPLATKTDENI